MFQIFHVCLPVTYPDGPSRDFRWSFICPEETTFNQVSYASAYLLLFVFKFCDWSDLLCHLFHAYLQEAFTCVRTDEMNFDCTDSEKFYELNRILGLKEETSTEEITSNELAPIPSQEYTKSKPEQKIAEVPIVKETNAQRFKVPAYSANNLNRISTPITNTRNQNAKKTTIHPIVSTSNTDRVAQTTNFREPTGETTLNDFTASTTFPPINIAQFFELTTRRPFNFPTTTFGENAEYTTAGTVVADFEQATKASFVPDLYETSNQSKADEVVDSIKQLQKLFPSNTDERSKRFLFKSDSVKNRQKLFEMLNHH